MKSFKLFLEAVRSAEDEAYRRYVHLVNDPSTKNKTPEGVVADVAREHGLVPRHLLNYVKKRAGTDELTGQEKLFPDVDGYQPIKKKKPSIITRVTRRLVGEEDESYWASMPHEHLHSELHNHLVKHGFNVVGHKHWEIDPLTVSEDEVDQHMLDHGFKGKTTFVRPGSDTTTWDHPNGSTAVINSDTWSHQIRLVPPEKKMNESADDHDYWASMPPEHLHAETHAILTSTNHDVVSKNKWEKNEVWERMSYHENREAWSHHENALKNIGWKADLTNMVHPNGSKLRWYQHNKPPFGGSGWKFEEPS